MSEIDKDIEDKAQEVQDQTPDQHSGDAMDDAEDAGSTEQEGADKKRRLVQSDDRIGMEPQA